MNFPLIGSYFSFCPHRLSLHIDLSPLNFITCRHLKILSHTCPRYSTGLLFQDLGPVAANQFEDAVHGHSGADPRVVDHFRLPHPRNHGGLPSVPGEARDLSVLSRHLIPGMPST